MTIAGSTIRAELDDLIDVLAAQPRYALDTEFHREKTYFPRLALIQLAWPDGLALVDPQAVDPAPLRRLFASPALVVAHAAQQDLDVLTHAMGAIPSACSTPRSPPASSATARRRCRRCCRASWASPRPRATG